MAQIKYQTKQKILENDQFINDERNSLQLTIINPQAVKLSIDKNQTKQKHLNNSLNNNRRILVNKDKKQKQKMNQNNEQQQKGSSSFLLSFQQYLQNQFIIIQKQLVQMNNRLILSQKCNQDLIQKIQILQQENITNKQTIQIISKRINLSIQKQKENNNQAKQVQNIDQKQLYLQQKQNIKFYQNQNQNIIKLIEVDRLNQKYQEKIASLKGQIPEIITQKDQKILSLQNRVINIQNTLKLSNIQIHNLIIKENHSKDQQVIKTQNNNIFNEFKKQDQQKNILFQDTLTNNDNIISQIERKNDNKNQTVINQSSINQLIKQNQLINKKLYQVELSFNDLEDKINKNLQKYKQSTAKYEDQVQQLKNQVQDFKLKKQAKYLKLIAANNPGNNPSLKNSVSNSSGSDKVNHNNVNYNSPKDENIQDYLQYLAQKVHYLTLVNKQLLPKQTYENQIEYIHQILLSIRKRLAQKISYQQINKINSVQDIKVMKKPPVIYSKNRKNQDEEVQRKSKDKDKSKIQQVKQSQNNILLDNNLLSQKLLQPKLSGSEIQSAQHIELNYKPLDVISQLSKQKLQQIFIKVQSHGQFMKQMNKFYNQKLNSLQISIQKINKDYQNNKINQQKYIKSHSKLQKQTQLSSIIDNKKNQFSSMKSLGDQFIDNYKKSKQRYISQNQGQQDEKDKSINFDLTYNDQSLKSKQYVIRNHLDVKKLEILQSRSPHQFQSKQLQKIPSTNINGSQMHNFQMNSVKKKINKLNGKYESVQNNFKIFKQQILKHLQILQKNQQNKADWQSFKKAIKYFDQKTKILQQTVSIILKALKQEGSLLNNNSSSNISRSGQAPQVAAKRKWSCLFCDKQIKNYQGKVSDVKYMGVFPNHRYESPRLGGYYKQSVKQKEYEKLYLNGNTTTTNNRILHKSISRKTPKNSIQKSKQAIKNITDENIFKYNNLDQNQVLRLKGFQQQ